MWSIHVKYWAEFFFANLVQCQRNKLSASDLKCAMVHHCALEPKQKHLYNLITTHFLSSMTLQLIFSHEKLSTKDFFMWRYY